MPVPIEVLVIDDNCASDLAPTNKLPMALELAAGRTVSVGWARDYAEAQEKKFLDDPDLRVVLLDQVFDDPECRHLDEELRPVEHRGGLETRQGFLIARRIAADRGRLRPAILVFTREGEEVGDAEALHEKEFIDQYQGKPETYASGDAGFAQLVDFLARHLDPLRWAEARVAIDLAFGRFLISRLPEWRRDAHCVLEPLLEAAHRLTGGVLTLRTWRAAQEQRLLPDLTSVWRKDSLWKQVLRPLGEAKPWRPWDPEGKAPGRLRYFRLSEATRGNLLRIVVLLDPSTLPELSAHQRAQLEALPEVRSPEALGMGEGRVRGMNLFRLPLPWCCPGGGLPWLIGTWYEVPTDGDWVPLAAYREAALVDGGRLTAALQDVYDAVKPHPLRRNQRERPCKGLLAEGVLINRKEMGREGPFDNWRTPFFPLNLLNLHPDPAQSAPLRPQYLQRLAQLGDWLDALASWFAWGSLPPLSGPRPFDQARIDVERLLRGEAVEVAADRWWVQPNRRVGRPMREKGCLTVAGARLEFPARTRCLGIEGKRGLHIGEEIQLADCELVCERRGEATLPLFEEMTFDHPLVLRGGRVVDGEGQPAELRFRRCTFRAGVTVGGVAASRLVFQDCAFENRGEARITNLDGVEGVRLEDARATIPVRIANIRGGAVRVDGVFSQLHLGPNLRLTERLHLDLAGPGKATVQHSSATGRFSADVRENVELAVEHCRWDDGQVDCMAGAKLLRLRSVVFEERLFVNGPPVGQGKGPVRTTALELERCQLRQSLVIRGDLAIKVVESRIEEHVTARGVDLRSLEFRDVTVGGALDLRGLRMHGPFAMRGCFIGEFFRAEEAQLQAFTLAATNCVGNLMFAGSHFHGPLRVAQRGEDRPDVAELGDNRELAGVVLRDQVDFSAAVFDQLADFSHTVMEHEAKFQGARFKSKADFRGLQAGGNLVFTGAKFSGEALFGQAIVEGLLDMQEAEFSDPPNFSGATLERVVRLGRVRWPDKAGQPAARFRDTVCNGLLDLSTPFTHVGERMREFQIDLTGATVERLELDPRHMRASLDAAARSRESDRGQRHRLARLARLFETALSKEMRFTEADEFYRRANRYQGGFIRGTLLDWLWGHGTRPWLVFIWLLLLVGVLFGLTELASWQMHRSFADIPDAARTCVASIFFTDLPKAEGMPAWFPWSATVLLLLAVVLLNLFFAGLARKLLR